ncbi:BadF/BadG/BcrA/BcrD ATPase family protein [Caldimonas brevitalea]|uniref:Glucosamine kinase n=1 Tax=Caldimonas brevitalea TaxID=413882 RepID=A0A0G3BQC2_9BURK|nr:BadF/BadG/BcrA/BcrD ATPase family protein [Caldimonas brevitalea]AKJ31624.1 glucosamine kinase [Caldimonas brevitalea]
MIDYLVGVDGGGTGTRARVTRSDGQLVGVGQAGPSALGQGIEQAWRHVRDAVDAAFAAAAIDPAPLAQCAVGLGLSGVHNIGWRDTFLATRPASPGAGFAVVALETDAFTMLLGAHGGQPGAIVSSGTGSVGELWRPDGARVSVGGWGFPVGDEGSGAWLGQRAVRLAQWAMDGRIHQSALVHAVWDVCGSTRERLLAWCDEAGQFEYAQLAPLVFDTEASDLSAAHLLQRAVQALDAVAHALDGPLGAPLAVCGSIGRRLASRLSEATQMRRVEPAGDAADGALHLVRHALTKNNT